MKILETAATSGPPACVSDESCGMPAGCVDSMLSMLGSSMQPAPQRLLAGQTLASLLRSHKCQRTALRCAACRPSAAFLPAIGAFTYRHGIVPWTQALHIILLLPLVGSTNLYVCRATDGFEKVAGLMTAGKEHDKAQTHLALELITAAVRVDGGCKAALTEKLEILKCISSLLAFEQVSMLPQTLPHSRCASRPAPYFRPYILNASG